MTLRGSERRAEALEISARRPLQHLRDDAALHIGVLVMHERTGRQDLPQRAQAVAQLVAVERGQHSAVTVEEAADARIGGQEVPHLRLKLGPLR